MAAWGTHGVLPLHKGYFDGLLQAFLSSAFTQPLRSGFHVLRVRQQAEGRSLADEVARLRRELPSEWFRGSVAHLLRAVVFHTAMGVFKVELQPYFSAHSPTTRHLGRQAFCILVSYPLFTVQTRMTLADPDTTYPDLILDHIVPQRDTKCDDVQGVIQYGLTLLGNLYAGILPFVTYLAVQIIADELAPRAKPQILDMIPTPLWMYGIRMGVRLACHPLSTIAVNLQTGKYANILHCVTDLYANRGIAGFWDGVLTEVAIVPCEVLRMVLFRALLLRR